MRKVLIILTLLLAITPVRDVHTQSTCTHYASPGGSGNGLTQATPFQISSFWAVGSLPGKVLCLLNGTYVGATAMIQPTAGLSGTIGNPITVRALNDGSVLIDGQDVREPVVLDNNDWFVTEGINAARSNHSVVTLKNASDHNILRRIVLWKAGDGTPGQAINEHGLLVWNSSSNLFEDLAGFHLARNVFQFFQSAGTNIGNTCRRCWARWEGYGSLSGPEMAMQMAYNTNVRGVIWENFIATWTGERENGAATGTELGGFNIEGDVSGSTTNKVLGGIAYVKSTAAAPGGFANGLGFSSVNSGENSNIQVRDLVVYVPPAFASGKSLVFTNCTQGGGCMGSGGALQNATLTNATLISPQSASIGNQWTQSNVQQFTTVGAAPSIFSGGTGAKVCFKYNNGTLSSVPLWPWPMDQRIKDALALAGSTALAGSAQTVTSEIESIFGTIPAGCRTAGTGGGTQLLVLSMDFSEGTGTTTADDSGLSNNGTLSGGVTWNTTGVSGNGLTFDGSSGKVTVANSSSLQLSDGMTWIASVKPTTISGWQTILSFDDVYYLYASSTGYCLANAVFGGNPSGNACYAVPLSTGVWSRIGITFNGAFNWLYVNGLPVTFQSAGLIPSSVGNLTIGASKYGEFYHGQMDKLRGRNYAFTDAEMLADFQASTPQTPSSFSVKQGTGSGALKTGSGAGAYKYGAAVQ